MQKAVYPSGNIILNYNETQFLNFAAVQNSDTSKLGAF